MRYRKFSVLYLQLIRFKVKAEYMLCRDLTQKTCNNQFFEEKKWADSFQTKAQKKNMIKCMCILIFTSQLFK